MKETEPHVGTNIEKNTKNYEKMEDPIPDIYITKCIYKHHLASSPHFPVIQAIFSLTGR